MGIGVLRPRMLFSMEFDPLTHGVMWSLLANVTAYVVVSLDAPAHRHRARAGDKLRGARHPAGPRHGFPAVAHRGHRRAAGGQRSPAISVPTGRAPPSRSFRAQQRRIGSPAGQEADVRLFRFAEHLLASAVGVASARLVIALMLERHSTHARGAMRLLDDASAAIQHNRDLLQSAIDNVDQGIAVFEPGHDADLLEQPRSRTSWRSAAS